MQKPFKCKNGKNVTLLYDDDDTSAQAFDANGKKIGEFHFSEKDEGYGHSYLKLTWAHLEDIPGYVHQGIGRELIKLAKEASGLAIVAEVHDGIRRDDGSHLTGDAPAFIYKMRREGLIARASDDGLPDLQPDLI